jgi:hypothetical protein
MSNQITTAFVQQFSDNLIMLAQQKGSRLRDAVMNKLVTGDAAYFERIGPTDAQLRTTRHGNSPQVDTPHSRRRVTLADYEWGDLIDRQDEIRMLIDPKSPYAMNAAMAMGRKMDDLIISAATGSATSVSSSLSGSTSSVTLPTAQVVDEDFGTGSDSNLTVEKLIEARRILLKNNIDMDEPLFIVVNASAIAALLNTTQITSSDYNTVKALVRGDIDSFMGFKFIHTERLNGTADGTDTAPVEVIAFAKSGLALAVGQDINVRIAERSDKSFSTYVYASMSLGATRVEEEKVVKIECVQAA